MKIHRLLFQLVKRGDTSETEQQKELKTMVALTDVSEQYRDCWLKICFQRV